MLAGKNKSVLITRQADIHSLFLFPLVCRTLESFWNLETSLILDWRDGFTLETQFYLEPCATSRRTINRKRQSNKAIVPALPPSANYRCENEKY
jgi:hypothetical protein